MPAAPLVTLRALLDARTPAEEIIALVAGLREPNGQLWLRRACFRVWPRPSLSSLANERGITSERARQIASGHDASLRDSGLRLPLSSRLVEWVTARPHGSASTAELLGAAKAWGIDLPADVLRALHHLSTLGLVPRIAYQPRDEMWYATGAGDLQRGASLDARS